MQSAKCKIMVAGLVNSEFGIMNSELWSRIYLYPLLYLASAEVVDGKRVKSSFKGRIISAPADTGRFAVFFSVGGIRVDSKDTLTRIKSDRRDP